MKDRVCLYSLSIYTVTAQCNSTWKKTEATPKSTHENIFKAPCLAVLICPLFLDGKITIQLINLYSLSCLSSHGFRMMKIPQHTLSQKAF